MASFIQSIRRSIYLKFMMIIYLITLCLLGLHLLQLNGIYIMRPISFKLNVSVYSSANIDPHFNKLTFNDASLLEEHRYKSATSTCPNSVKFPAERYYAQTWQKVGETGSIHVFSAYHDDRQPGVIHIIGIIAKHPEEHYCQLWYTTANNSSLEMKTTTAGSLKMHSGTHKYMSCFVKCSLPDKRLPVAVSLVPSNKCEAANNLLLVKNIPVQNYTRNFTVCACPLNFRYGRAYELVEWIELNRILGADYFVVYNYSSAANVADVLKHYSDLGILEVVQWPLSVGVDTWPKKGTPVEVHYFAQMASLNDCLLRSKGLSEYLVNVDLDEFIVPRGNQTSTWLDVIKKSPSAGAYMFRNTFFRKEWSNEHVSFPRKPEAEQLRLVTLLKTIRETSIFPRRQRSKYIVKTSAAYIIVTHDIAIMNSGQTVHVVPPNLGLLHHYRNWLKYDGKEERVNDSTVIDKYADVLLDNVEQVWKQLQNVAKDIPTE